MVNTAAGSVSGGGFIESPAGAYFNNDTMVGKATFAFVSEYKKGMSIPSGNTKFQFQTAGLVFTSTSYQWLVVTGSHCAKFKGIGMVNGKEQKTFILTACDKGQGGSITDTFRIQIDGVYDYLMSPEDETSYKGTIISG